MSGAIRSESMIALTMATLTTAIMSSVGTTLTTAGTTRIATSTTLRMQSTATTLVVTTMTLVTMEEVTGSTASPTGCTSPRQMPGHLMGNITEGRAKAFKPSRT